MILNLELVEVHMNVPRLLQNSFRLEFHIFVGAIARFMKLRLKLKTEYPMHPSVLKSLFHSVLVLLFPSPRRSKVLFDRFVLDLVRLNCMRYSFVRMVIR
jgi:hypothetical protein